MSTENSASGDGSGFAVRVLDLFHYMDEEEESVVDGFPSLEAAREYARRRTRDSVEEHRTESASAEDLRHRWHSFGEDCLVIGVNYAGGQEIDYFIAHPATAEERDWVSLTPNPQMRELLERTRQKPPGPGSAA